ncbi:hypothetical protein AXG93_2958s1370 [Marchantia polymorpha subsp. ruderalis]|uniref:ABC transporter domain-containing protein n=1 Tax=Marchantia polymorpha subsp. ruderalis TaxID=1480154 RepID=A0A176VHF3_MARPO|nr:hypothetical protein AXG93_2958s1370 [Marchantia polymorpha subsp. ruderalis]
MAGNGVEKTSLEVTAMNFAYPGKPPFISNFNLSLQPGSRCLLIGANGAGKTTLLRILAGKHMVGGRDVVRVLGRSAFHDTSLVCGGELAYLGGSWSRTVGCAGEIPLQGDFSAEFMIFGGLECNLPLAGHTLNLVPPGLAMPWFTVSNLNLWFVLSFLHHSVEGANPERRQKLIELLDIDLRWRMHKVSDGQRRRVQICMGLLQPFEVLLLDEITVDLDVVARLDLLEFFKEECEQRGACIVYATHIFDGLETWASHIAYVEDGTLKRAQLMSEVPELTVAKTLIKVVEPWLRREREEREKAAAVKALAPPAPRVQQSASSLWGSSRHMAYYR